MKREAERLQLAKSGYADSQLADPEVPQEPDIEALCAKAARTYDLTRREEDVLRLLVEGRTAPQIAEELVVSPNTVKTHVRHIYAKMDIHSQQELIDYAIQMSQNFGIDINQLFSSPQQMSNVVADLGRSKALIEALKVVTVKDTNGADVDLSKFFGTDPATEEGAEIITEVADEQE